MNTSTNKTLSELYAEFKEHLDNPSTAFQDAALNTAVKIEAAVREILEKESHPIDPRRIRRYGLDTEKPNPLHITLAQEAQVLKDTIGIGLSTHHLLNHIIRRRNYVAQMLEPKSYEEICKQLGIVMSMHPDGKERPFVPTTHKNTAPQTGSGTGFEAKKDRIPKFLECIRLLPEIATPDGGHIDTRDLLVDMQDATPEGMLRTLPYAIIRIPRLNRTILVNDEHGQATFVLQGLIDISLIQKTNKDDLVKELWAQRIVYHPVHWKTRLERYLLNDWEYTTEQDTDTDIQNAHTAPSSTAYLSDNPDDTTDTYTLTKKNEPKARIKNLDRYPFFLDAALIRETLLQFAEHISTKQRGKSVGLREWGERESPKEKEKCDIQRLHSLSTNNPSQKTCIILSNGESMTWLTYLKNASAVLFETTQGKDGKPHRPSDALNTLKQSIELILLDKNYFTNEEYITHDLIEFSQRILLKGEGDEKGGKESGKWEELQSPEEKGQHAFQRLHMLSVKSPSRNTRITLANGESMTWMTYLNNASAVFFGTTQGKDGEPHRPPDALNRLKETIELIFLDKNYFTNEEHVTRDLIKFSQRIILEGEEDRGESKGSGKWEELQSSEEKEKHHLQRLHSLSTNNPSQKTCIILSNGESMTWLTYLKNASAVFFGTTTGKDGESHRPSYALNRLKKTMKLILFDADYFKKPEYITKDLETFAGVWGISVDKLSTYAPSRDTHITLTNGESMSWERYLINSWKLLDPGKKYTQAQALKILKERAGFITSASVRQGKKDIKTPKEGDELANEPFAA